MEFGDILGGQLRVMDDEGNTVVIEMVVGQVVSISDGELAVTANDDSERTFTITDDTVMPQRPEEGDSVVIVMVGDSNEARLVLPGKVFHLLGTFDGLRTQIRERLEQMEVPWLDIPRLRGWEFESIPEWRFHLWPEWDPELVPLPERTR